MPNQVPTAGQPSASAHQGPLPTPQMRQLQIEMQRVTQQYSALGGNNGNPAQTQPIVQRMQQLKQQYQMLGHQQITQYRQQQQHLQQQQQQQAVARNTPAPQNGQTSGNVPAMQQTVSSALPQQLDALFGQGPGPNATPQAIAQFQENQAKVQGLIKTMSELKVKLSALKGELDNNPNLTPEQRTMKDQQYKESAHHFARYQNVLQNLTKSARAQQQNGPQQAAVAAQQTTTSSPVPPPAKPSPVPPTTNSPNIPRPVSNTTNNQPTPPAVAATPTPALGSQTLSTPLVSQPVIPQQVPPGRPSLNNGQVGPAAMTGPALARPPVTVPFDPSTRILGKRNLSTLLNSIDPSEKLDPDVEDVLLDVADEFIESVIAFSCRLAKHRKTDTLGVQDVKLTLEREWNIQVMGFADEKIDSKKRITKEGNKDHKAKLAAVNTAKSLH